MPCLSITSQLSCCFLLFYLNCLLPTAKNKMTTTLSSSSRDDDGKWKRMNGTNPNPSINFVCTQHTTFMPSCISLPLYLILPAVPFPLIAIFTSKRLASFFQWWFMRNQIQEVHFEFASTNWCIVTWHPYYKYLFRFSLRILNSLLTVIYLISLPVHNTGKGQFATVRICSMLTVCRRKA